MSDTSTETIAMLREEIRNSQTARQELFKWKIIMMASVGAAALGLETTNSQRLGAHAELIALIPWIGVFVDAVAYHSELGLLAIAAFLRREYGATPIGKYEVFCERRRSVFAFELWMLAVTSVAPGLAVLYLGLFGGLNLPAWVCWSAALGVAVWTCIFLLYQHQVMRLARVSPVARAEAEGASLQLGREIDPVSTF